MFRLLTWGPLEAPVTPARRSTHTYAIRAEAILDAHGWVHERAELVREDGARFRYQRDPGSRVRIVRLVLDAHAREAMEVAVDPYEAEHQAIAVLVRGEIARAPDRG